MPPVSEKVVQLRQLLAERFGSSDFAGDVLYHTGVPILDEVGIPRGAITELVVPSVRGSGMLLLCSLLHALAKPGERVAVVDGKDSLHPCGFLPVTPDMTATATKALQGCEPQGGKIIGAINKNGVYTLTGDLFQTDQIYSVIDDDTDVILCQWQKPGWKAVCGINVHTMWNFPAGYRAAEVERSPDDQPQPFWLLNLQGRSLLVIASYVEKEGQNYYVVLFDPKTQQIVCTDSSFSIRPEVKNDYLLTGDSSRVKAEWGATYFSRIQNNDFKVLKRWEDSEPWHSVDWEGQPDDTSNYASSDGRGYLILPDNSGSKHPADYLIVRCDPNDKRPDLYPPPGKPFAAIYFTPNKGLSGDDTLAYLFERLTGLPRDLYPGLGQLDTKGSSDPKWKIKVAGTDKAIIQLLSQSPGRAGK